MVPYCETAVRVGLARIPPAAARYVPETPAALARRVCRIARDEGYFADGFFNPLDLERLYKSHPTLLAPVLTGSIMAGYDRNPAAVKLPRGTFLRVARRASVEAYRRGLVQVQSFLPWDYQVEHPAFDRLFAALVRQARAESSQP
jgi:hypothetical protein